jgi:hypothetical protein
MARIASLPAGDGIIRVVAWDASGAPSGTYFAVLQSGSASLSRTLVIVR